jgi:hypothetical protein
MSIIQTIMASISAPSGGGGGGGGGGPTYLSWTIEWWEKKLSPQVSGVGRVFACGVDTAASIGYSNESGGDYIWTGGTGTGPITVGSIANAWHHFAVVSNGTQLYHYKDGVNIYTTNRAGNPITDASTYFYMGGDTSNHWKGRITDFHIIKGRAKYSADFTPPGRLSVESGSVFLLPFNNNSYTPLIGPSPTMTAANVVGDDPWGDSGGSIEFTGQTNSFIRFDGQSTFALDAA